MQISRMDLADKGSPEGIVLAILKAEPNLPIPVPIEELCRRLDIMEIQALTTEGFEGGLLTDRERSSGIILVKNGVSRQRRRFTLESVRRLQAGLHSFLSMRRIEARRKNASAFRLRFSQSLASLRQRLSHAMVRSMIQRLGKTTNPLT